MRYWHLILVALTLLVVIAACGQPAPTATAVPPPSALPSASSTAVPPTSAPPAAPTAGELATLGQAVFDRSCTSCHGAGFAPAPAHWIQRFSSAKELYDFARTNMPPSGPGSLKPEEYLQVVAWELVGYKVVPSDAVLDVARLADIAIPK
jgi:cytochrome c5